MTSELSALSATMGDDTEGPTMRWLALLNRVEADVAERKPPKRSTVAQRKAAHKAALATYDVDRLLELAELFADAIDNMTSVVLEFGDPDKAAAVMAEILDETTMAELLAARREDIREAVFEHIDATHRAAGVADPEHTNGSIEVPTLGKKFTREGAGRSAPRLNEEKFRAALGDQWEQVYQVEIIPEQVIPQHVEYILDPERILALAESDPGIYKLLEDCLIPGEYKTPKFHIRNL